MKQSLTRLSLLLLAAMLVAPAAQAQFSIGTDLVSRYVWRGFDFGDSFSIQPTLEYSSQGEGLTVTVGTWASYSIAADGAGANEHDLYLSFSTGPLSFGVTDYYFPNLAPDFFNFENDGAGSHFIEPFVSFGGTESFPVNLYLGTFLYNDPEMSTYLEASIPFTVAEVELGFAIGAIGVLDGDDVDGSAFYVTKNDFTVSNISLSASKAIPITDRFALPVSVSYTLNPDSEMTYLVFGVSL